MSPKMRNEIDGLFLEMLADQDERWGGGAMSPVAYDTAWVAMVRDPQNLEQLAFPRSMDWLLRHQAADGSWSSPYPYSLLPTMAALLALKKSPVQDEAVKKAAFLAEHYLKEYLPQWSVNNHESVGFEVLAPVLLQELEKLEIMLPFPAKDILMELYHQKMKIAGIELLYSGQSNLIHSLEAFGAALDWERLKSQQAANGSYGCSPAATAAVLIYNPIWDEKAAAWLTHLTEKAFGGEKGGMPNAYPIDAFEASWVLYNLVHGQADIASGHLEQTKDWLRASLTDKGASISRLAGLPMDSDDTGMVLAALGMGGDKIDVSSLTRFEREKHFACYEIERGISLSANAHVLAALACLPLPERRQAQSAITKLVEYIYQVRDAGGFWTDKWHVSPYYSTVCCVLALAALEDEQINAGLEQSVCWVLETQMANGGWGYDGVSSLEETAYALQILQALPELAEKYPNAAPQIAKGKQYLEEHLIAYLAGQHELPRLWRGKELYTPYRVVLSAALGCLTKPEYAGQLQMLVPLPHLIIEQY